MANAQSAPGWLVPQQRINLPPVPQQTGAVCAWAGRLACCEHGILAFFRYRCRVSPSHTPVTSFSIPPEGACHSGWQYSPVFSHRPATPAAPPVPCRPIGHGEPLARHSRLQPIWRAPPRPWLVWVDQPVAGFAAERQFRLGRADPLKPHGAERVNVFETAAERI